MPDMLVSLLELPPLEPLTEELRNEKIVIRRSFPFEITRVQTFIKEHFGVGWADEISVGLGKNPSIHSLGEVTNHHGIPDGCPVCGVVGERDLPLGGETIFSLQFVLRARPSIVVAPAARGHGVADPHAFKRPG